MIKYEVLDDKLTEEEFQSEIEYALSKQMLKKLLFRKLITQEKFEKIDELNIKTFNPKSLGLFK